jgi:hypothetical protein
MEHISWVKAVPARVTFKDVQRAIIEANRVPPHAKKIAWNKVYSMSAQYKKQEDLIMQSNKLNLDFVEVCDAGAESPLPH